MSEDLLFLKTKTFIEGKDACRVALMELKKGTEIQLSLDGREECACFFDGENAQCELRPAKNPDVEFRVNSEAVRRLEGIPGENLADVGIEILREIIAGNISIKIIGSSTKVLTNGYLGVIKKAGPDFLSYLGQHGLSHIFKIISYIKKMRQN